MKQAQATVATFIAAATAGGIIAQLVAGKAVRDALFLSTFDVQSLPYVVAGAALLSLIGVLGVSRTSERFSPRRVLPILFGLGAAMLVVEWLAISFSAKAVAVAVYLHISVLSPIVLSTFW